jgi:hypothetical protein
MADVTVKIDVECQKCGADLATDVYGTLIQIEPCSECLAEARQDGYDDGLNDAGGE